MSEPAFIAIITAMIASIPPTIAALAAYRSSSRHRKSDTNEHKELYKSVNGALQDAMNKIESTAIARGRAEAERDK